MGGVQMLVPWTTTGSHWESLAIAHDLTPGGDMAEGEKTLDVTKLNLTTPPPGASQSTYTSAYRLYIMCMGMVVVVWFRSLTCCLFDYPTKSVLIDHTTTLIRLWCGSKAKHACTLLSSFNIVSSFRFSIFFFSKR